ncbi:hypothetical protein SK128_026672, partial [Halocaridina rubra]
TTYASTRPQLTTFSTCSMICACLLPPVALLSPQKKAGFLLHATAEHCLHSPWV